jgi:hypothetical protein
VPIRPSSKIKVEEKVNCWELKEVDEAWPVAVDEWSKA